MSRSLRIGSVSGIGIFVHWTFSLLLLAVPALYLWQGATPRAALVGTGIVLLVFGCVLLHELGHALTARRFSVPTRDITLYPIGGVARLERIPEEPMKEFWIAVAGPGVNVAIAAVLAGLAWAAEMAMEPSALVGPAGTGGGNVLATLLWVNVALALFNMLPAFPMDGGRVLRALLATRLPYARATQIAANVGQLMALGFALFGLYTTNFILLFIAVFVYLGAQQEARQATLRQATQGLRVRQAMMTRFQALAPDDRLERGADELLAGTDHDFPVVDAEGGIVGLLTRQELIEALSERGPGATVAEVTGEGSLIAEANENLNDVFLQMRSADCSTVPVVEDGRLVGLLTMENVTELMMISSAIGPAAVPGGRGMAGPAPPASDAAAEDTVPRQAS